MKFVDILIKLMNLRLVLLKKRRKDFNFRWANSTYDALSFVGEFAKGQYTKVYGRITSRYNYHPQQRHENSIRQFDVTDSLRDSMKQNGNAAFYRTVCGVVNLDQQKTWEVDLTRIGDLSTVRKAGDYVYQQVCQRRLQSNDNDVRMFARESAEVAQTNFMRGFTRSVNASDYDDWEKLRNELRCKEHLMGKLEDEPEDNVTLVALSYKGKDINITRRMQLLNEDGSPDYESGVLAQVTIEMTSDFLDDFRWSQLVRSCMEIAKRENTEKVRVWIDRLIMMGLEKQEIARRYHLVDWEEFGLFAYAVCPVVRLYDQEEKYAGSDFWRKLETVLGVAGKGIVVDDYMLRKYDETIFYGSEMYERFENGLSRIGGNGVHVKATTLALATALLTDGVTTNARNEDLRTKRAVGEWKAWALRAIAEGAYSKDHFSMLAKEEPFRIRFEEFWVIAFWESFVSLSKDLTGKNYLDMSYERSRKWSKNSRWNGVIEWIGRIDSSCEIEDRDKIMTFITNHVDMQMWATTTGHVACWITLRTKDRRDNEIEHKRSIVVNLSRFSTAQQGQVTGIAEATGLWKGSILPSHLRHVPNPCDDQKCEVNDGEIMYKYKQMRVEYACLRFVGLIMGVLSAILFVVACIFLARAGLGAVVAIFVLLGVAFCSFCFVRSRNWPWVDQEDVGEALFDNLLLHSLYESGIKAQYRELRVTRYDDVSSRWN